MMSIRNWCSIVSSSDLRVAIVTGAGQGLGRAEAVALARSGARVVLNDLPGAADEAAEEIRGLGGEVRVAEGDVGERATADLMVSTALDKFGSLDIVVNNAGITRDRMLFNLSDEEWDLVLKAHRQAERRVGKEEDGKGRQWGWLSQKKNKK